MNTKKPQKDAARELYTPELQAAAPGAAATPMDDFWNQVIGHLGEIEAKKPKIEPRGR